MMASYVTSSSSLSWGSILFACFAWTPNKDASNFDRSFSFPLRFGSPNIPEDKNRVCCWQEWQRKQRDVDRHDENNNTDHSDDIEDDDEDDDEDVDFDDDNFYDDYDEDDFDADGYCNDDDF